MMLLSLVKKDILIAKKLILVAMLVIIAIPVSLILAVPCQNLNSRNVFIGTVPRIVKYGRCVELNQLIFKWDFKLSRFLIVAVSITTLWC
jgi:hypothetical protein